MEHDKRFLFFVLLTALWVTPSVHAASFDPGLGWQQLKSPHFMVYFGKDLSHLAPRAARLAEDAHAVLSPKYDWKPLGRTVMVLTDNHDQANGLATVIPYNTLLIRVTAPHPDTVLAAYDDWLKLLITHEYLHIIHLDQARGVNKIPRFFLGKMVSPNGVLPGWMREGLAVHEETVQTGAGRGRASFADMLLRTDVLNDDWKAIDEADGLGWRWPGFLPQYIHGAEFLEWLGKKYGENTLVEYQTRTARSSFFYMHNSIAKKVWGKTLYTLWKDWRAEMETHYGAQITAVRTAGETPTEVISDVGEATTAFALSPDGTQVVYNSISPKRSVELRLRDLTDGSERILRKGFRARTISWHPRGHQFVFSAFGAYKRYNLYSDIYLFDIAKNRVGRLTVGRRASDPTFAPDGKSLIYVVEKAGRQWLARYDISTRKESVLPIETGPSARFSKPRWSPDGKLIAVSSWQQGQHDLYVYYPNGILYRRVTQDRAIDTAPVWGTQGRTLYYVSDRSGISNVYRYVMGAGRSTRVTNVLTGVFLPDTNAKGELYVQYYDGTGFDLRRVTKTGTFPMDADAAGTSPSTAAYEGASSQEIDVSTSGTPDYATRKYNPFGSKLFLPRYLVPNLVATGNGLMVSAITGGSDPLHWHNWLGGATYRTDSKHVGYLLNYYYNRFLPTFNLGVINYAVDLGNITFGSIGRVRFYEKRTRGYAGFAVPFRRHRFRLQYFLEQRKSIPNITAGEKNQLNLDQYAGMSLTYSWGRAKRYPASISNEKGQSVLVNFSMTDAVLGASERNEQRVLVGEVRKFISLPWHQHVIALRAKGGWTWGDRFIVGNFSLGGDLGEGSLGGGGSLYYFGLRGLPVTSLTGTRAMLSSVEYRVPLVSPQRGLGTTPFYLKNLHAAVFADYGNAWFKTTVDPWKNFFLGTGAELRADFVLGHGLPVVGRLGYGVVVLNRDRLGPTVTDPLFGQQAKNGVFIVQWGISF